MRKIFLVSVYKRMPQIEGESCQATNIRFLPCPGRGAAFFMPLRRTGTVPSTGVRYGPGSAKQRFAKSHSASKTRVNALMALHRARDTVCAA
jgi:hypothetical protein